MTFSSLTKTCLTGTFCFHLAWVLLKILESSFLYFSPRIWKIWTIIKNLRFSWRLETLSPTSWDSQSPSFPPGTYIIHMLYCWILFCSSLRFCLVWLLLLLFFINFLLLFTLGNFYWSNVKFTYIFSTTFKCWTINFSFWLLYFAGLEYFFNCFCFCVDNFLNFTQKNSFSFIIWAYLPLIFWTHS